MIFIGINILIMELGDENYGEYRRFLDDKGRIKIWPAKKRPKG